MSKCHNIEIQIENRRLIHHLKECKMTILLIYLLHTLIQQLLENEDQKSLIVYILMAKTYSWLDIKEEN